VLAWLRNLFRPAACPAEPNTEAWQPPTVTTNRESTPVTPAYAERDAFEGWFAGCGGPDLKIEIDAEIDYVDGNGQATYRRISIHRFAPDYVAQGKRDFMLLAHCHLRNGNRSFVGSRIRSFVSMQTGEVVRDVRAYLLDFHASSPVGRTEALVTRLAAELSVLVYVARADQRLSAKEKKYLIDYLRQADPTLEPDPDVVDAALAEAPPRTRVVRTIKALRDTGRAAALLPVIECLRAARTKPDAFTEAAAAHVIGEINTKTRRRPVQRA
jgi:hypothetical protein